MSPLFYLKESFVSATNTQVIQACPSSFIAIEAWKIPSLENDVSAPGWALSAIMSETSKRDGRNYGQLVGCYVVREYSRTRIIHASDFRREYIPIHVAASGYVSALPCEGAGWVDSADYLHRMATWIERLGNVWEGPDGCGTYETDTTRELAEKLRTFVANSEAIRSDAHCEIRPFFYLPPHVLNVKGDSGG